MEHNSAGHLKCELKRLTRILGVPLSQNIQSLYMQFDSAGSRMHFKEAGASYTLLIVQHLLASFRPHQTKPLFLSKF
jgi:hypothetical protein